MSETERGKLLYQMPKKIYLRNRKKGINYLYGSVFSISSLIVIIIITTLIPNPRGYVLFQILLISLLLWFISLIPKKMESSALYRFKIYEKGFIPCTKPFEHIYRKKVYFIPFNDIDEIKYFLGGGRCVIKRKVKEKSKRKKKHDEVDIYPYNDIEGYLKFSHILKDKLPDKKYPDFRIVRAEYLAFKAKLRKRITQKEYQKIYDKLKEVNKDFL